MGLARQTIPSHANSNNVWWEASEVYSSALVWEGSGVSHNCSNPHICYNNNFAFAVCKLVANWNNTSR